MAKSSTSGIGYQIRRIVGRGRRYLEKNGFKATVKRFFVREKKKLIYKKYLLKVTPNHFDLERMKEEQNRYTTKFSLVIPVYRTNSKLLQDLIDSVLGQTYRNFEICFADASGKGSETERIITAAKACDPRIKYKSLDANLGISENTNEAIIMSSGDFLVFCDHDDILRPDALYQFAKAIKENPNCEAIYSDQDKVDSIGRSYYDPFLKPDYDPYLLESTNYICHLLALKRELVQKMGPMRQELDGSQDYDYTLRACEMAKQVVHVPEILYRWRISGDSTADESDQKLYAYEAGKKALEKHFRRTKLYSGVTMREGMYGVYHTDHVVLPGEKDRIGKDYILFQSPGLEIANPNYREELLGYLLRPEVGIVGGIPAWTYGSKPKGMDMVNVGTFYLSVCPHSVKRVGSDLFITKKELWDGFSKEAPDKVLMTTQMCDAFCDYVLKQGKTIVYNPYVMPADPVEI